MAIFKKKKASKKVPVAAPEEEESQAEIDYEEDMTDDLPEIPQALPKKTVGGNEGIYQQVPVCLSQAQINSLVIENNIMLKQIIAEIDKD